MHIHTYTYVHIYTHMTTHTYVCIPTCMQGDRGIMSCDDGIKGRGSSVKSRVV